MQGHHWIMLLVAIIGAYYVGAKYPDLVAKVGL